MQTPAGTRGSLLLAGVARAEPPRRRRLAVVVVGSLLDPVLTAQREKLVQDYQAYRQLVVQKDDLRASHLLLFLMVTMVILLASSWTGLYLARRVTVPIQALAEGTRRISGGDLSHRVDVVADDELGVLVDSFNRMTEELESNKEQLERSNLELTASNQRLADERALIAAVLENVAAGVVSIDSQGRIFTCNGAALNMLRQREQDVVGRPFEEAWGDPDRKRLAAAVREVGRGGHGSKEIHLTLGGEWKTFELKVTALRDAAGAIQGGVVVIEDLTELIKAQQLAAWNEAARRIAHEIKNPLTPIRLSAERLLRKHQQGDPGLGRAIEEGVEIIVREVVTLQGMVDEFSRYARMPRPQPAPVDLSRLVGRDGPPLPQPEAGVEVEGDVDAGLDRGLDRRRADPARADQPAGQRRRGDRGSGPGHASPRSRSTATWRSRWRTPAGASPRSRRRSSSSPTSPPRGAAPASASRSSTASSPTTRGRSGWRTTRRGDGVHGGAADRLTSTKRP